MKYDCPYEVIRATFRRSASCNRANLISDVVRNRTAQGWVHIIKFASFLLRLYKLITFRVVISEGEEAIGISR